MFLKISFEIILIHIAIPISSTKAVIEDDEHM